MESPEEDCLIQHQPALLIRKPAATLHEFEQGQPMKFKSHMLRDTFTVEMLLAGVAPEDVSRLLTHTSIKITEEYYRHWVPLVVVLGTAWDGAKAGIVLMQETILPVSVEEIIKF
jgi:hypothetical protein